MKLFTYYIIILLPFPFLYWAAQYSSSTAFFSEAVAYVLLYRPLVDGFRLMDLGVLEKSKQWRMFYASPYYQLKYFRELYFTNN